MEPLFGRRDRAAVTARDLTWGLLSPKQWEERALAREEKWGDREEGGREWEGREEERARTQSRAVCLTLLLFWPSDKTKTSTILGRLSRRNGPLEEVGEEARRARREGRWWTRPFRPSVSNCFKSEGSFSIKGVVLWS